MAEEQTFVHRLESALEAKRASLERNELAKLKESWKLFQAAFHGISNVLLKKGVIHEDPYKYEMKISDVQNPPDAPFLESERAEQMSLRISQFEAYVEFLINYYQFDTDFLSIGRIKRLLAFVKYFNFTSFQETSTAPSTRGLAELVGLVRRGNDPMSGGILSESVGQLERSTRDILSALKALSEFQREAYKLEVRSLVMPGLAIEAAFGMQHREEAMRKVKAKFAEVAGDRPFFPELVSEILDEDCAPDGQSRREEILRKFAVSEEKKAAKVQTRSYKSVVIEGIRILAGAGTQLEDSVLKLSSNSSVIESAERGFMQQLRKAIRKLFGRGEGKLVYEVAVVDALTGEKKSESIDFGAFIEEGTRKARLLSSLLQRNGPTMKRLETAEDDHVFKFLERNIEELQRLIRRLNALDDHFKSIFPTEEKAKFRGIKSEITTIKNCIIKANQKKHEFHAQVEEEEQLRRLGVRSD
ncbi:MAG TPA: hypothetical protein VMV44_15395 [Rectinemataceae bacterium]|nr:hypothetical protein [Rectinemataceae bacterium]